MQRRIEIRITKTYPKHIELY
ncbi:MAG: hypothetical protein JWL73_1300, partial [Actinomycetia bacterium]|nr:hypothetical protein [Actinomycetes bacterium]